MDDLAARTQEETAAIVLILTELTGLPSRWSGRLELVPDAEFRGRKRQTRFCVTGSKRTRKSQK